MGHGNVDDAGIHDLHARRKGGNDGDDPLVHN